MRKPSLAKRIRPHRAGRLVNELKRLAVLVESLPNVNRSPDPNDDFLLGLAEAGKAEYLVTGDKSHLLSLITHGTTRIVTAQQFATSLL